MSDKRKAVTERIADLFCMLESNHDGEVLGAIAAMKRLFQGNGLSFADMATVIADHQGEIEEKKYSDADAEIIYARGVEKGRAERSTQASGATGILRCRRAPALPRDRAVLPEGRQVPGR
jgi:hypothetical protein